MTDFGRSNPNPSFTHTTREAFIPLMGDAGHLYRPSWASPPFRPLKPSPDRSSRQAVLWPPCPVYPMFWMPSSLRVIMPLVRAAGSYIPYGGAGHSGWHICQFLCIFSAWRTGFVNRMARYQRSGRLTRVYVVAGPCRPII